MKVLLLTLILTTIQPTISEKAEDLAKLNNGNVEATTSDLIDWLYAEGGLKDSLAPDEVVGIKKIVELNCGIIERQKTLTDLQRQIKQLEEKKADLDVKVQHQQRINEEQRAVLSKIKSQTSNIPAKSWSDNIKLSLNYADGSSCIHYLTLYGYKDPNNPVVFIFNPAEQAEYVQGLLKGASPKPVQYAAPSGSLVCTSSGCYRAR